MTVGRDEDRRHPINVCVRGVYSISLIVCCARRDSGIPEKESDMARLDLNDEERVVIELLPPKDSRGFKVQG